WAENVVIKVPMTAEGLKATRALADKGIKTNVTLIFSANQALMAARAGATYVSPFLGRLDDISFDGLQLVRDIVDIFMLHDIPTEIIAASIRHPVHMLEAAKAGAHIATAPYKVYQQMLKHPLTDIGIERFLADWRKAQEALKAKNRGRRPKARVAGRSGAGAAGSGQRRRELALRAFPLDREPTRGRAVDVQRAEPEEGTLELQHLPADLDADAAQLALRFGAGRQPRQRGRRVGRRGVLLTLAALR